MHKTIYVEKDEEITSVLDRIEREPAEEIFLVIPKNAMISQGIINLRLLKSEVEKMAKKLIIVANDPHTKKVVSELGIATSEKAEADPPVQQQMISQKASEEAMRELKKEDQANFPNTEKDREKREEREIGSASFFDQEEASNYSQNSQFEIKDPIRLKKELFGKREPEAGKADLGQNREAAFPQNHLGQPSGKIGPNQFQKPSALSAVKGKGPFGTTRPSGAKLGGGQGGFPVPAKAGFSPAGPKGAFGSQGGSSFKPLAVKNENRKQETLLGERDDVDEKIKVSNGLDFSTDPINKKAEEFFSGSYQKKPTAVAGEKGDKGAAKGDGLGFGAISKRKEEGGGIKKLIFVVVALVVLVAAGALTFWVFDSFPKVEVGIYPKIGELEKEVRVTVVDGVEEVDFENGIIPGKYQEIEISKTIQATSSGEEFAQGGIKAEGKVKIINKYSEESQPLVATTRVLSKEGKLFRLKENVVVPGMKDGQPGEIEVAVIADKAGEDFNIGPSVFTIEGFKGTPKYEKFEVVSEKAMFGGADPEDQRKVKFVTEVDINKARERAVEELEASFEEEVQKQLGKGERTIIESVEKNIVSSEASNKAGDKVDGFSYTIVQKVKLISFNENDVVQLAESAMEKEIEPGYFLDQDFTISFRKGIPDFERKEMAMDIEVKAKAIPSIDENKVKEGIAGKSEEEIKNFLADFEEINKAEVTFDPIWLKKIPITKEKVMVKIREE